MSIRSGIGKQTISRWYYHAMTNTMQQNKNKQRHTTGRKINSENDQTFYLCSWADHAVKKKNDRSENRNHS